MNQDTWYLTTSRLALVAAFAAGLAASPFAISDGMVTPKGALAQTDSGDSAGNGDDSGDGDTGGADDDAAATGGSGADDDGDAATTGTAAGTAGADDDGAAEEFVEDPTSDVGGSGSPGVSSGEKRFDTATMNTNTPAFQEYKAAVERNDLEAAAAALSESELPEEQVTPEMIEQVNEDLDVRTSLTAEQIAEAVRRDQPY